MGRRTPLYQRHLALGAKMVEFAGWEMPLQYAGIRSEHLAVRERAGVFDVSHMGEVRVHGRGAGATLQRLVVGDVTRLVPGRSLYTVMCTDEGGIVDDVVVLQRAVDDYLVVVNAATREKDVAWMRRHLLPSAEVDDLSDQVGLLAVQGPRSPEVVAPLLPEGAPPAELPRFSHRDTPLAGHHGGLSLLSRTGYTGEDGFELFVDAAAAPALWDAVVAAGRAVGLVPCGLGARDTLRLEAGLRLYGQDMDESVDPFSAGLGWTVRLDKGDFIGAAALRRLAAAGPPRQTIGLRLRDQAIARHGHPVLDRTGERVGTVTSGTYGFSVGCAIALALVERGRTAVGDVVGVVVRDRVAPADVVSLPFYRRPT